MEQEEQCGLAWVDFILNSWKYTAELEYLWSSLPLNSNNNKIYEETVVVAVFVEHF